MPPIALSLLALALGAPAAAPADPALAAYAEVAAELARDREDPRALSLLSRVHDLEPALADLSQVARLYQEVADDPRAEPEARSLARWRLAGVEQARGNLRRAEAELAKLGFVRGFFVAGPFDNEGRRGLDTPYPPEEGVDLEARYPGKAREVGWRALPPEAQPRGILALGAVLRPEREVTVYAFAVLDSPREQRARLWLGSSGAWRAWLNGTSVATDPGYHPARLDQVGVELTLRKGPNRLLLKLCHDQGEPLLLVRLTDRSGRALGLKPAPPPLRALLPGAKPRPERIPSILQALERRASRLRGEKEGQARMDLATALAEKRADDAGEHRASREARRAAELLPRSARAQLLAALLEDEDPNAARERVEAALAVDPRNAAASLALAEHEARRGRPHAAVRILEPLVARQPGYLSARVALAQAWEQVGLPARAQLEMLRIGAETPDRPLAVEAAARAARRLERADEATHLLRKLLALRYDDGAARASLAQLLLDRGDLDGALEQLAQAQRLDTADVWLRLRRADLLAANGRLEEAAAEYQTAARLCPDEPEVYERRGRARLREGKSAEALADLQRALDLKPQSPQLKELVRQLQPERERFETPYLADAAALAKAAPTAPERDEDAVVLSELKVTRVYPSGLSATYVQQVVKVFTPRGADAFRTQGLSYVPGRQDIRVERARVWKPDGTAVETHQEADQSTSEPWYRLYYDTRARVVSFPALSPGDVLEFAWRSDDVASENLLSDYFGEVVPFADSVRKLEARYVLLAPEGRHIYSNEVALPGLQHGEKLLPGGVREHLWAVKNLPRLDPEMGMPGPGEGGRYVHVSTYPSWAEVARFYEGLVREQLKPGPAVRAVAERIAAEVRGRAAGRSDEELRADLVRAVYDYVVTNVRYVGLEFGIHGYKPYQVDQILQRRFGDCKDKASLMHALLEVLGIDSRLVLLRMHRLGAIPEKPASLAVFNHAILYVPGLDLWLDGTATGSGSRELPAEDRGATVLVLNPGSAPTFTAIPDSKPEDNRMESEYRLVVGADGSAKVAGTSRVSGVQAPGHRRAFQAQSERKSALEQSLSSTFPGMRVESVEVSDPSRIEGDVALSFRLSVPRLARVDRGGLSLRPFGQRAPWTERYAPLSTREHDLVLGQPFESHLLMRYALPPGLAAADLPSAQEEETPFGSYRVSIEARGGDLVAESVVRIRVSRIRAADYPAFRDLLSRLDGALSRTVRLAPAATKGSSL